MAVAFAAALGVAVPAGPARAQRIYGTFDIQYQNTEAVAIGAVRERWITTFETDYEQRLPQAVDLLARVRFSQQTLVGRLDRQRTPEGSLRLAHRYFGFFSEYRPTDVRDVLGVTTHQQSLTLTGYVQKPGLPTLSGSWIRTHYNANDIAPGTATRTRTLSLIHTIPHLGLHAGYGDRELEPENGNPSRLEERHGTAGAASQFQLGRAPVALQYDFTQSWTDPSGRRSQISRLHAASFNTSMQWARKTSSAISYIYRRADVVGQPNGAVQDHNGSASITQLLTRAWSASAGAGVRSAVLSGRTLTERFVTAGTGVQGQARRGWTVGASAGHTVNWLPGDRGRTTDAGNVNTMMRIAPGLDGRADFSISATERPALVDSFAGGHEIGRQVGLGLTALPLRTIFLDGSVRRAHTGISGIRGSTNSTSYSANARVTPNARFQLSGGWSETVALLSQASTVQGTLLWSPSARLQASGTYTRAHQNVTGVAIPIASDLESLTGSVSLALARDLSVTGRYSDSYRRQPGQVREWSIDLVKRFGS